MFKIIDMMCIASLLLLFCSACTEPDRAASLELSLSANDAATEGTQTTNPPMTNAVIMSTCAGPSATSAEDVAEAISHGAMLVRIARSGDREVMLRTSNELGETRTPAMVFPVRAIGARIGGDELPTEIVIADRSREMFIDVEGRVFMASGEDGSSVAAARRRPESWALVVRREDGYWGAVDSFAVTRTDAVELPEGPTSPSAVETLAGVILASRREGER